ncbi:uncharacterized protein LOC131935583 [Physella acuta]|uniref:uncharacterized protein LOC131935583 n=1 Tax=Physella acuta TaxID=109671 RepID=UPI0027DBB842|nr:uncharacterized protein LOC131935583 [Physella acuta]
MKEHTLGLLLLVLVTNQLIKSEIAACSENGWWYYNGHCYLYVREERSWSDAQKLCLQHDAYLATFDSREEEDDIKHTLNNRTDIWIGIYKPRDEVNWKRLDGNRILFTNWEDFSSTRFLCGDICVALNYTGKWLPLNCELLKSSLCKIKFLIKHITAISTSDTKCPDRRWLYFNEHCYLVVNEEKTWTDSKNFCLSLDANLASLESQEEIDFLKTKNVQVVWIGLSKNIVNKSWVWEDGGNRNLARWDVGEPGNSFYGKHCGLANNLYRWENYYCYESKKYVCKVRRNKPNCPEEFNAECKESFMWNFEDNYYFYNNKKRQWVGANNSCSKCRAELVSIESHKEMEFLKQKVNESVWIGLLRENKESSWKWPNGDFANFTNWDKNQPLDVESREHCVHAKYIDKWHDFPCATLKASLCKKKSQDITLNDPIDTYLKNTTVRNGTLDTVGKNTIEIGLTVTVSIVIVAALIMSYICYSRRVLKMRVLNQRNFATAITTTNEIEDDYETLDETVNEFYTHSEGDQNHDYDLNLDRNAECMVNLNLKCPEPGDGQVSVPPLPCRPQQCQYIELGLVPIREHRPSSQDITSCLNTSSFKSHLKNKTNTDESDAGPSVKTGDKSIEHSTLELSKIINTKLNSRQQEFKKRMDAPILPTGIKAEKQQLGVNPYDSTSNYIYPAEENEYFPFSDHNHTSTLVDNTNGGNDEYHIPLEPVVFINFQTLNHSFDQTVAVNDSGNKKQNVNETKKENKYGNSDRFLTPLEQSFDDNTREDRCKLDTVNVMNVIDNGNYSDTFTTEKHYANDESYIYPIDPDDTSLPIAYGYHTWDGAHAKGDAIGIKNIHADLGLTQQEIKSTKDDMNKRDPMDNLIINKVDADDQSYIYPIDPDDPSLPIAYGYHTWDVAHAIDDSICSKNIDVDLRLPQQETNSTANDS